MGHGGGSKGSATSGFVNFMKSLFGAGILTLPHTFAHIGLIPGVILYLITAAICTIVIDYLLKAKLAAEYINGMEMKTYRDVGRAAFGQFGVWIVQFQVVFLELAFCAGFIIVALENLEELLPDADRLVMCAIALPILILLAWIRWLKDLWIIAALGLLVYVAGVMGFTYVDGGNRLREHGIQGELVDISSIMSFPLFIGSAVYSLEGINLVIPIAGSLKDPSKSFLVVGGGMAIYAALCTAFGAFAYAAGMGECDIITGCLTEGASSKAVKIALVFSLTFTHPLTLYPATEIIEQALLPPEGSQKQTWLTRSCMGKLGVEWNRRLIRAAEVTLTVVVGYALPHFSLFSDLIGSFMLAIVGFIVPSFLYLKLAMGGLCPWQGPSPHIKALNRMATETPRLFFSEDSSEAGGSGSDSDSDQTNMFSDAGCPSPALPPGISASTDERLSQGLLAGDGNASQEGMDDRALEDLEEGYQSVERLEDVRIAGDGGHIVHAVIEGRSKPNADSKARSGTTRMAAGVTRGDRQRPRTRKSVNLDSDDEETEHRMVDRNQIKPAARPPAYPSAKAKPVDRRTQALAVRDPTMRPQHKRRASSLTSEDQRLLMSPAPRMAGRVPKDGIGLQKSPFPVAALPWWRARVVWLYCCIAFGTCIMVIGTSSSIVALANQ